MRSLVTGLLLAGPAVCAAAPAHAESEPETGGIVVVARAPDETVERPPASRAAVDAATIATTVNAMNVEDTLKYLPSLVVRKRHIGDTQAPLATRTSGLGASARSLIYADGALLSALIGNNNTSASPRWSLVSTEEIARIEVLYGPFSAAYPGNSIGVVVNIATRLPDALEATAAMGVSVQDYDLYGTHRSLPAYQIGGTVGDRFGPLALFASADHVDSRGQPLGIVTAPRPAATSAAGLPVTGGYDDLNRAGQPVRVLGSSGFEHQLQDRLKLRAALDLSPGLRLAYAGSLFLGDTEATAESYLRDGSGAPVYAGSLNSGGRLYPVAAGAFSNGVYRTEQQHWSHSLSLSGASDRLDWQVIGTLFEIARDRQRTPGSALPAAAAGGAGTIARLDGTGWRTFDAKAAWRLDAAHTLGFGAHGDGFRLASRRYAAEDWLGGGEGALNLQSLGHTRTLALWAQDAWRVLPGVTLTLGGRYEWWRAYGGVNFSLSPAIGPVVQPERAAGRFSPKAALAWEVADSWRLRLSAGQAWRFPTVGELYQVVTSPVPAVPDPSLRPERARAIELAVEHDDAHGTARLALFDEVVADALVSQTGPLPGTDQPGSYVQNIAETRARGAELYLARRAVLPRLDLSGSATYADAVTSRNPAFPASVGRQIPGVPRWKASAVVTWRPDERFSLTGAVRYASRNWGTLDHSDPVGNTYQGFYRYLVFDARAVFRPAAHIEVGLGVDNLTDQRYFLFHPFPQRTVSADVKLRL